MALTPKQQRDTLDQTLAIKRSIVMVQTAAITKKMRRKKVSIATVIQPATISNRNVAKTYILRRFYILPQKGIFIATSLWSATIAKSNAAKTRIL